MASKAAERLDRVWKEERKEDTYDDATKKRLEEWQEQVLEDVNLKGYTDNHKLQKTFDTVIMEMVNTMREHELSLEDGKKIFAAFREMGNRATDTINAIWIMEEIDPEYYAEWQKEYFDKFNLDVNQAEREAREAREKAAREKLEIAFDATVMTMVTTMREHGLTYYEGGSIIVAFRDMESENSKLLDEIWEGERYEGKYDDEADKRVEAYQRERLQKINIGEVDEKVEKAFDTVIMEMVNTMREHELSLEDGKKIFAALREMGNDATWDLAEIWELERVDHEGNANALREALKKFNVDVNQAKREEREAAEAARKKAAREKLEKAFDATVMTMVTTMKENGVTYKEGLKILQGFIDVEGEDAKLLDEIWEGELYENTGDDELNKRVEAFQKERLAKLNIGEVDEKFEKAFDTVIMEMVNTMREHELDLEGGKKILAVLRELEKKEKGVYYFDDIWYMEATGEESYTGTVDKALEAFNMFDEE